MLWHYLLLVITDFINPVSAEVLDTTQGIPGKGIEVHFFRLMVGHNWIWINSRYITFRIKNKHSVYITYYCATTSSNISLLFRTTDADGKASEFIHCKDEYVKGIYKLVFDVEAYFDKQKQVHSSPYIPVSIIMGLMAMHNHNNQQCNISM